MNTKLPTVQLYWSFRSPYSFLVTPRLRQMVAEWEMRVDVRVVMPIAVRIPDFFKKVNPLWGPYLMNDVARLAEQLGMKFGWPQPDPVVMDYEKMRATDDQPYIYRLSRMGVLATEQGRGLEFLQEVSGIIFGGVKDWDKGEHLQQAVERAGCDLAELDQRAEKEADRIDAVIEQHEKEQQEAGHWGVPLMVYEGEAFFGQDRVDTLLWRMRSKGLKKRI